MVNIQIPLMLGELTNIVTKFASDTASDVSAFLLEIKLPAVKLMGIYCLQVDHVFTLCVSFFLLLFLQNLITLLIS